VRRKQKFFLYLSLALLFVFVAGALRAEEPGPWYLITESELRTIEEYQAKSEAEKQSWLLQASKLRIRAEKSEADSRLLNSQLSTARNRNRELEQSFNEYEAEQLTRLSLKNGEITDLKQVIAETVLKAATYNGKAVLRLVIIISLLTAIAGYIAFKICRFFRLF
jgi:hypothetical protein